MYIYIMFDPTLPPKILPFLDVWKCHSHLITMRGATNILKMAEQKEERTVMSSSWNPQNSMSCCFYQFWKHPTSRLLDT